MSAFQPTAFQSDGFQQYGGVTTGDFECTITILQESDGCNVEMRLSQNVGAPGMPLWVAMVNGKRIVGSYLDIQKAIFDMAEEYAEEQAEQPLAKPRRVRIVIQPGKAVAPKVAPTQVPMPREEVMRVQRQVRDFYKEAFEAAMRKIEEEEEDALLL